MDHATEDGPGYDRVALSAILRAVAGRAASPDEAILLGLREAIMAGVLRPGTHLRQEGLAEAFGTSRIPIREALRALEYEGLAISEANRGFEVTSVDADDVDEIYDLRILLESHAMRLAIPLLTEEDLGELETRYRAMATATDPDLQLAAREDFYLRLYSVTARPRLVALIMRYRRAVARPLRRKLAAHTPAHHELLWAAIGEGDADLAAAELSRHYRAVSARLRRLLLVDDPG